MNFFSLSHAHTHARTPAHLSPPSQLCGHSILQNMFQKRHWTDRQTDRLEESSDLENNIRRNFPLGWNWVVFFEGHCSQCLKNPNWAANPNKSNSDLSLWFWTPWTLLPQSINPLGNAMLWKKPDAELCIWSNKQCTNCHGHIFLGNWICVRVKMAQIHWLVQKKDRFVL